jgi:hypothetical protein
LEEYGVGVDKLVGQGYDGANVMSGHISGVQARMREKYKSAIFVHCMAHRLNLVIVDLLKAHPLTDLRVFFCTLEGILTFFSSPRRVSVLVSFTKRRLPANCKTR